MDVTNLQHLVHPIPEDVFMERYLRSELFVVRAEDPGKLAGLLPWDTINGLLEADCLQPSHMAIKRDGLPVPESVWYRPFAQPHIVADNLKGILRQGATLIIRQISDLVPSIRQLTDALQERLHAHVAANAYISFRRGSALREHFDRYDILVAQIHGMKRWWFYGLRDEFPIQPVPGDPADQGPKAPCPVPPIRQDVLRAGDLMFLPRGEWHRTEVEGEISVHLTIRVIGATGVDLARRCLEEVRDDVRFRRDIPRFGNTLALAEHEQLLKARLVEVINSISLNSLIAAVAVPPAASDFPTLPHLLEKDRRFHFPDLG